MLMDFIYTATALKSHLQTHMTESYHARHWPDYWQRHFDVLALLIFLASVDG